MKRNDIIFAVVCGLAMAWVGIDFFNKLAWIFFILLPILSIIGLWICNIIGQRKLFFRQAGRFALTGIFADVVDIKAFQLFALISPAYALVLKGTSFLIAMAIKYLGNKYWAFEKHEKDGMKKEIIQFFLLTMVGLALNVGSFYYFVTVLGPQFSISIKAWTELSIIFAALVAAVWNFLGYKFVVFKK